MSNYHNDEITSANREVQKAVSELSNRFMNFIVTEKRYWYFHDLNQQHLLIRAEYGSIDGVLLASLVANLLLDLLLFHNLSDYFIKMLIPGVAEWVIILASCLFPLLYMAIELKFAQFIYIAQQAWKKYPYSNWRLFWVFCWFSLGSMWAILPGAVFFYIMILGQEDSQLSGSIITILTILGILLHLLIVWGGAPMIEAKNRWYARWQEKRMTQRRAKAYHQVENKVNRTKGITSHHARQARLQNTITEFQGIPKSAMVAIRFVDEGFYHFHPLDRPIDYRFGMYRDQGNSEQLEGK